MVSLCLCWSLDSVVWIDDVLLRVALVDGYFGTNFCQNSTSVDKIRQKIIKKLWSLIENLQNFCQICGIRNLNMSLNYRWVIYTTIFFVLDHNFDFIMIHLLLMIQINVKYSKLKYFLAIDDMMVSSTSISSQESRIMIHFFIIILPSPNLNAAKFKVKCFVHVETSWSRQYQ